jgi:PAS domain S-box
MAGTDGKQVCSAGLVWNGSLIGAVEIVTGKDSAPFNRAFIETYLNMASLALQRRESEHALSLSEERFRRITAINPLPISIIDQYGRYTYLSPRFTEIFGYTLEDIPTGNEWFMFAFPNLAEQKAARDIWKRDLAESVAGLIRPREFRVRCKDGLFKEILFLPVSMSDGQQLIVYEDVTPRLDAIQTKNLLFDIFRSSHDGIYSTTINGRLLSWNPAVERIYGYAIEEVIGKDVRMLEPPSLKGEISSILEQVKHGEYITNYETKRVRKDGKLIDVSLTISPVYREGRTIMGASTIIRDITSHKAEERLRSAEMRYQDLVDNINVGVYRSTGDPEGKFIWGNTSLLRILGYDSMNDLQEIAVSDIFARSGGRAELLTELRQNGFVKNREIILRRGDGTAAHVLVTALATFSPDGSISYINGIVEDITDQRLLEQKVARLTRNRRKA